MYIINSCENNISTTIYNLKKSYEKCPEFIIIIIFLSLTSKIMMPKLIR